MIIYRLSIGLFLGLICAGCADEQCTEKLNDYTVVVEEYMTLIGWARMHTTYSIRNGRLVVSLVDSSIVINRNIESDDHLRRIHNFICRTKWDTVGDLYSGDEMMCGDLPCNGAAIRLSIVVGSDTVANVLSVDAWMGFIDEIAKVINDHVGEDYELTGERMARRVY